MSDSDTTCAISDVAESTGHFNAGQPTFSPGWTSALLDHLACGVAVLESETYGYVFLNKGIKEVLGAPSWVPAPGDSFLDRLPGWALARFLTEAVHAAESAGVWKGDLALTAPDGREVHVSSVLFPKTNEAGDREGWTILVGDRSEARKEQADLDHGAELFRVIAQNAADLVALFDTSGHSLFDSSNCKPLLGYGPGELGERWMWELVHADDKDHMIGSFLDATNNGHCLRTEVRLTHKDGSFRTFEFHYGVLHDASGEVNNVVLTGRDITERKGMELQLRQGQKLEAIGQLAAGIAHEINSPTQFIGDNTRFLRDGFADLDRIIGLFRQLRGEIPESLAGTELVSRIDATIKEIDLDYLLEEVPKAITQSLDGLSRVSKIVQAMKEFSHPGMAEKTPIDLNRAIESTITVARHEWKYVADMVMEFEAGIPPVPCLPGELNQVILNLIVNAAHAIADVVKVDSGRKGTITVSTARQGDWVEVRVKDTGTGIPPQIQNRIFDPFFTTKEVGKGTGQGLSISRSVVVDKHRGTLSFETAPEAGTTFIIRLPLALNP